MHQGRRVSLRLSPGLAIALEKEAMRKGETISEIIRRALDEKYTKRRKEQPCDHTETR